MQGWGWGWGRLQAFLAGGSAGVKASSWPSQHPNDAVLGGGRARCSAPWHADRRPGGAGSAGRSRDHIPGGLESAALLGHAEGSVMARAALFLRTPRYSLLSSARRRWR